MTRHLGLGVVRLGPQQVGKVGEVVAVVDESRDELRLVLEDEHGRVAAAGRHAAQERRVDEQLHVARLHPGAAVALLAPPSDLGHQPRQHGQRGAPVQRRPSDVSQAEAPVGFGGAALPLVPSLHDSPWSCLPAPPLSSESSGGKFTFRGDGSFFTTEDD